MKNPSATAVATATLACLVQALCAQTVVINEFRNASPDAVELLVVTNGLNMRGMILKDYAGDGTNDSGGSYVFTGAVLWNSVQAGTLVLLSEASVSPDTTCGESDYNLHVGLLDTNFFSPGGGSFDIAKDELVQLKGAGSPTNGNTGALHSFASGKAGVSPLFTNAPGMRLRTYALSQDTGGGESAEAVTPNATLGDYAGTNATGNGAGTLGTWNNDQNRAFIYGLRGVALPTDVRFTAAAAIVGESIGAYTVTVYKTRGEGDVSGHVTVTGTAAVGAGEDAVVAPTNFTLTGAVTSATLVVSVTDDLATEPSETVVLTLAGVTGADPGAPDRFTLEIVDNDAPLSVWINELHYDNSGTDTNEGVELAGRAGTDLQPYRLCVYNGLDGQEGAGTNVAGKLDDEGAGYGAVWCGINGLENGPPDGLALVRVDGGVTNVLQLLSYEGAFTASNGPAQGIRSTDIGVQESGSTPPGLSLQLRGKGRGYADFAWAGPTNHSRGLLNAGQTFIIDGSSLHLR